MIKLKLILTDKLFTLNEIRIKIFNYKLIYYCFAYPHE